MLSNLARLIDQTLLRPDATHEEITRFCMEAKSYNFWAVCVNPCYVRLASKLLINTDTKVCSVIGFPTGANSSNVKEFEAENTILDGANEIDMVMNIGALKSGNLKYVKSEMEKVVQTARRSSDRIIVKIIIETGLLTDMEKTVASKLVRGSGANFVKTSTGFQTFGATVSDVRLIRKIVGPEFGIKASGGIRTYKDAINLINAGANRIGTSCGVQIVGKK